MSVCYETIVFIPKVLNNNLSQEYFLNNFPEMQKKLFRFFKELLKNKQKKNHPESELSNLMFETKNMFIMKVSFKENS